jgi:hypothetical protein
MRLLLLNSRRNAVISIIRHDLVRILARRVCFISPSSGCKWKIKIILRSKSWNWIWNRIKRRDLERTSKRTGNFLLCRFADFFARRFRSGLIFYEIPKNFFFVKISLSKSKKWSRYSSLISASTNILFRHCPDNIIKRCEGIV